MKSTNRLFWLVALAMPLSVTFYGTADGANQTFTTTWDSYTYPLATAHAECRKGTNNYVEVGSGLASAAISFVVDVSPGDQVDCTVFTTWGDQTSPRSEVASTTIPFPKLPAPTGVRVAP